MSLRAAQVLSMLVGCAALAAETHVHASSSDSDAGSAVPAHQKHPVDPKPPAPKGKSVELTLPGGRSSTAYVARPKKAPHGGLLVVHEWWGLNDAVKAEADGYAGQGYLVLAVDLFAGTVATDADEAQKLMSALDEKGADRDRGGGCAKWLPKALPGKKIAPPSAGAWVAGRA